MRPINLNRFDLISLRLFVAAVDRGSLTAGARDFGISVPAASKRMADLEAGVGAPLLERGRSGVRPTAIGQTLYRHAVQVVGDLAQLASAMSDYARGVRDHIRVWANTSAVTGFMPSLLSQFLADHPGVAVDLEETNSEPAVEAVRNGAADLCVFADNVPFDGIRSTVCDADALVLICDASNPLARRRRLSFAQALNQDFVGLDRNSSLMRLIRGEAAGHGVDLRLRVQVRSFDAMARMIAAGLGVGILPRTGAAPLVSSMRLRMVPLADAWAQRALRVGWRDQELLSAAARALLQTLMGRQAAILDT